MPGAKPRAARYIFLAILGLVATTLLPAYGAGIGMAVNVRAVLTFLLDLVFMAGVVGGFGFAVTGQAAGVVLSTYNDYSLSKLQMALWTVVVLASLLTVAKLRLLGAFGHYGDPLNISVPGELMAAMGIAAFTTAATPSILALKAGQRTQPGGVAMAQARANTTGIATTTTGNTVANVSPDKANWTDIVTGDEPANAGTVDLSKVQQLIITLLLLGTYIGSVVVMLANAKVASACATTNGVETCTDGIAGLPAISQSFVELLAVSHAGYLTYKAAPKAA